MPKPAVATAKSLQDETVFQAELLLEDMKRAVAETKVANGNGVTSLTMHYFDIAPVPFVRQRYEAAGWTVAVREDDMIPSHPHVTRALRHVLALVVAQNGAVYAKDKAAEELAQDEVTFTLVRSGTAVSACHIAARMPAESLGKLLTTERDSLSVICSRALFETFLQTDIMRTQRTQGKLASPTVSKQVVKMTGASVGKQNG